VIRTRSTRPSRRRPAVALPRAVVGLAVVGLAAWTAAAPAARAQTPAQPVASAPRAPAPLTLERYQLANGLTVILAPDRSSQVAAVDVWYDVGARNERPGRTGFAHLFEHMMFRARPT
jgi:zinc protease